MKITIEHLGLKFTAEFVHDDIELSDIFETVKYLLISVGYSNEMIDNCLKKHGN